MQLICRSASFAQNSRSLTVLQDLLFIFFKLCAREEKKAGRTTGINQASLLNAEKREIGQPASFCTRLTTQRAGMTGREK